MTLRRDTWSATSPIFPSMRKHRGRYRFGIDSAAVVAGAIVGLMLSPILMGTVLLTAFGALHVQETLASPLTWAAVGASVLGGAVIGGIVSWREERALAC